jgi:hypothetical protein
VRDDDLGMELSDMGRSGDGSGISSLVFEQVREQREGWGRCH